MLAKVRMALIGMITAMFILSGSGVWLSGYGDVYAEVGSIAAGEDITYDKEGGVLKSMGFDTSKMPESYDPDATTNPYGEDVSNLNEVDEVVLFDTTYESTDPKDKPGTYLYGHNNKLNGNFQDFLSKSTGRRVLSFLPQDAFVSAIKCDITGDGRDSALAVVYTRNNGLPICEHFDLNMRIYDPVSGRYSEEFTITQFSKHPLKRLNLDFLIQSQVQITAGDYDKDSIDEIAVYAPAKDATERNTIQFYDLIDGKDCKDPFSKDSWQHSWNYMLPNTNEKVIKTAPGMGENGFAENCYNNVDLTSGDADNDGICDLIVSYGASDTDYADGGEGTTDCQNHIVRSIPSRSVLLYGRDDGQMLRDSQPISYGGQSLIRVSFAFGDVDSDGNEDMFLAGQLQGEQSYNISRTIGRYVYDEDAEEMSLESMQNMKVVDGTWGDSNSGGSGGSNDTFYSSNGWDGYYYSAPLMKTNMAIGKIFGDDSNTKIYLDSVLYSYDNGNYNIEDELEDDSRDKDGKYKGSCIFAGDKALKTTGNAPASYFEYGASCNNYTASPSDYLLVNRVSVMTNWGSGEYTLAGTSSVLFLDKKNNLTRKDPVSGSSEYGGKIHDHYFGAPLFAVAVDTDIDGLVAEYTGEHNIQYQDPTVLAVLASPPYFKDVVAYDEGDLLVYLNTEYGTTTGSAHGHEETFDCTLGVILNSKFGADGVYVFGNVGGGYARSETWGWEKERTFEMSYTTEGGEDAVVMYSVPTENYVYKVHGVTVDDDGNCEKFTNTMVITKPHKPVTQTLTLEDYNEIQERYADKLPDVTKYLTSTPGDPSSYPTSEKDLSDEALSHIDRDTNHPIDYAEKWAGTAFGSGSITQSINYSKETRDRYKNALNGGWGSVEIGKGTENHFLIFDEVELGLAFEFSQLRGSTYASITGADCSGTIKNMPRDAKGYGYGFSWKLLKYNIKDKGCTFPVVTYMVSDVTAPPELPEIIEQDFDQTTDSQIALTWTYNKSNPQAFDIYRYEDFPIGGGEKLIGTVDGSDYKIMKDEDGNTLKDQDGRVVRGYTFIDKDLTADTRYEYRMKVRTAKLPGESIFSPVIEARTDVGTKPDLTLSTDELTIYPDNTYGIKVNLADPENYQSEMSYQWQKYDAKKRKWEDVDGCNKQVLHFYNCTESDTGIYRCRVNLIRKVESSPQYISAFTESCSVDYSLRSVKFDNIQVFEGKGNSRTNTGISVHLSNTSKVSREKPTGEVVFSLTGPNGTFHVAGMIDEESGDVIINSIEDLVEDLGTKDFVDGGYLITANYGGNAIFYPALDPEEYHYLRNIDESIFLSMKSTYYFSEDVRTTAGLYDYKSGAAGKITRKDLTDQISRLVFYQVAEDGIHKTGEAVADYDLTEKDAKAPVPLDKKLAKKAYVEAYMTGAETPAAGYVIKTRKIPLQLTIKDKTTGTGDLCEFLTSADVELTGGVDPEQKNIVTDQGKKSLADFMLFSYYEQNGDFICDSEQTADHISEFVPASYIARLELKETEDGDDAYWFYSPTCKSGRFMVVGNYYFISAGPVDKSTGSVSMISPDTRRDFTDEGYVGGTKIVLKAEPNPGYKISKWIIDDCGNKTYEAGTEKLTFTVRSQNTNGDGRVVISAEMVPTDSRINISKQGNGQVGVTPEVASGENVLAGTKLTFTAIPDPGWHFAQWHLATLGGDNVVSDGTANEDGSNTKEFTMPDTSAEVSALFARDTVDVAASAGLDVLFVNNGGDPYHDTGELVKTEKGKNVPKGAAVIVRTKPGVVLAPDAVWNVTVNGETGPVPVDVIETMSQGMRACTFTLPDDARSCEVSVTAEKGKYTVDAETEGVTFTISVDGQEMEGSTAEDISSGAQVDIRAKVDNRGQRISGWIINGETRKTTDSLYTCNITENMSVAVTTEPVDAHSMKISAEGGGSLKYTISDPEGDQMEPEYVGENDQDYKVTVYQGESVRFESSEKDDEFTLTSISLNGVKQDLTEGAYTINSVEEDTVILARFSPNKYCNVLFNKKFRSEGAMLLDWNDNEIGNGETLTVPKSRDMTFSLILPEGRTDYVDVDGNKLTAEKDSEYPGDRVRYTYKVENVRSDITINVADHEICYIGTGTEMQEYLNALASSSGPYGQPDGILTANIDMAGVSFSPISDMYSRFDGNGYTVTNLSVGNEPGTGDGRIPDFHGIFGTLHVGAYLKDVAFHKMNVHADAPAEGCGLLTYKNYGMISGVSIIDSKFDVNTEVTEPIEPVAAGLAYENLGQIKNCIVSLLTISTNLDVKYAGSAGVKYNNISEPDREASMTGNYFEYLFTDKHRDGVGTYLSVLGTADIVVADHTEHHGTFESNYYRQTYETVDPHGINAFKYTENPDDKEAAEAEEETPEFSRKLAYTMNKDLGQKVWGITDKTDDPWICLLSRKDGTYFAPVKVEYVSGKKRITRYCAPGEKVLPGEELFGEDTPIAWEIEDKAYQPGSKIDIREDMKIFGIGEFEEYVAALSDVSSGEPRNTIYYKDIDEAIKAAADSSTSGSRKLDIIGDAAPAGDTLNVPSDLTMTVMSGVTLTINKGMQINNSGTMIVESGATVHKYGSLLNEGRIVIKADSSFMNYGSAFVDNGEADGKQYITCKPHLYGAWTYADTPDEEGRWTRSRTCTVCEHAQTVEVPKNPPAEDVKSIEITTVPDQTTFDLGDTFDDKGLRVTATLNDGSKATITEYTLALKIGENEEKAISKGDVLDEEGIGKVTVNYDKFSADYEVVVINMPELLTLTDGSGNEITEAGMETGDEFSLKASLKFNLPYNTRFEWQTSDESIASLASETGADMTVTALEPGTADITVTVIDEKGRPVDGVKSRKISFRIESHIKEIKILDGDISIDKGESHRIKPEIIPGNATDSLEWSSSDENVAVVDENGLVTGTGGGEAWITVTTPQGLTDSCKVRVSEKAEDLKLNPEELEIDTEDYDVLWAMVKNPKANGEVIWNIDDPQKAAFYVKNEATGEMETVATVKTRLSADGAGASETYVIIAGISKGETTVTARTESESGQMIEKTCTVTVKSSEKYVHITQNGAQISGEELKLDLKGRRIQLGAESSEDGDTFTWTAIDDKADPVIRVDNSGMITLRRKGTAAVQVTSNLTGEKDTCLITVVIRPTGVELSENEISLPIGATTRIQAKLLPEGSEGAVIWTSSDESIVIVSGTGEITAVSEGEATVQAVPDAQGAQGATCKVKVIPTSKLDVKLSQTDYIYDGEIKLPKITVMSGDKVLGKDITESNENVIVSMAEARLPGTYTVNVSAREWIYGSAKAVFQIRLKPTELGKSDPGQGQFTAHWDKVGEENITGYQIRYSSQNNMTAAETRTVENWNTESLTVKGITEAGTYHVQVRTYLDQGGSQFYSTWSEADSVNVEKAPASGDSSGDGGKDGKDGTDGKDGKDGKDGTSTGPNISEKEADKAITEMKTDSDPKGSEYGKLELRSVKQTKSSIKLQWTKVPKARKYVVYGNKCGKNVKPKKLATLTGNTKTIRKIAGKKLKQGTNYKFIVVAIDKNKKVVSISKLIHVAAKSKKIGNYKSVKIKKATLKKAINLKKNKSLKLGAKVVLQSKKLKVKKHIGLRYESTNKKIATISKNGVIKAKKKGTCYVYAYAQNGVFKKVKVVVK